MVIKHVIFMTSYLLLQKEITSLLMLHADKERELKIFIKILKISTA